MTINTEWFARYLRVTREHFEYSQAAVATAGGPHRQLQAAIESGDELEVSANVMAMFDRAYGWPIGYTQALAELGRYASGEESLSDALLGDDQDLAAHLDHRDQEPRPGVVRKTLAALYGKESEHNVGMGFTYLGFDPDTGEPSFMEGPVLTNVGLDHLHPMILARHGATTIDVGVLTDKAEQAIQRYADGYMVEGAGQEPIPMYRVGVTQPAYSSALVIDPLSGIATLSEAKHLAADLLRLRPDVATTAVRAGYTMLAIASFGEDPLVTLTELERRGEDTAAREFEARFGAFWAQFYDPTEAGPKLAQPDRAVCDLLAGVLEARDQCMEVVAFSGVQARPRYEPRRTVKAWELMDDEQVPVIFFYDGKIVPELPIVQSRLWPTRALTFYAAELPEEPGPQGSMRGDGGEGVLPQFGRAPHMRVGITTADDRDIVARHNHDKVGTLTNYVAGQAIYCESGRARRVWIPNR
ncbi:hypothetical protein AB4Z39_05080 [Mycobacterium adipatum]|uniref:hypothetical protein n=1 Tax=Mycobacterium adipatum TaxID=1682113 RepID=UPI0034E05D8D